MLSACALPCLAVSYLLWLTLALLKVSSCLTPLISTRMFTGCRGSSSFAKHCLRKSTRMDVVMPITRGFNCEHSTSRAQQGAE